MIKKHMIATGGLVVIAVLLSAILTNPLALADDSHIDTMSVSVPESCTLTSNGMNSHSEEINNGQTNEQIGTTTIKVFCNDNTGYALYAIGYTDNEYGKTVMTNSALGSSFDIATATTVTTGTSSWAMKLTKTGSDYLPIIAGSSTDTNAQTGDPDFSGFAAVPAEYTKVAYYLSSTDMGATASGSNLTTTYRAYISQTQPAGTYVGQVKYTLVHPSTEAAPMPPLKDSDCQAGYVCYAPNASDIDGSMSSLGSIDSSPTAGKISVGANATEINLIAPNYKRAGYGFAGWSKDFTATTASTIYGPNETLTVPSDTLATKGMILYPVWVASAGNLQGWSGCNSLDQATYDSANNKMVATLSSVTALTDTRDNNVYAVAKLADGKCWMVENLRLDNTATITTANTNNPLTSNDSVALKIDYANSTTANHLAASNNTWCEDDNAACFDQTMLNTNNTNRNLTASYNGTGSSTYYQWYSYGNYYNWYSATAGNGTYSKFSGDADGDLCPTGWHLPYGNNSDTGNTAGGFYYLNTLMSNNTSTQGSKDWRKFPNNFVYSGDFGGSSAIFRSSYGYYWSSSACSYNYSAYVLLLSSSSVAPGTYSHKADLKSYGRPVRCIAQ